MNYLPALMLRKTCTALSFVEYERNLLLFFLNMMKVYGDRGCHSA